MESDFEDIGGAIGVFEFVWTNCAIVWINIKLPPKTIIRHKNVIWFINLGFYGVGLIYYLSIYWTLKESFIIIGLLLLVGTLFCIMRTYFILGALSLSTAFTWVITNNKDRLTFVMSKLMSSLKPNCIHHYECLCFRSKWQWWHCSSISCHSWDSWGSWWKHWPQQTSTSDASLCWGKQEVRLLLSLMVWKIGLDPGSSTGTALSSSWERRKTQYS
jgi:hypothetical protein